MGHCRTSSYVLLPDAACHRFRKNTKPRQITPITPLTWRERHREGKPVNFGSSPENYIGVIFLPTAENKRPVGSHHSSIRLDRQKCPGIKGCLGKKKKKHNKKEMKIDTHVIAVPG